MLHFFRPLCVSSNLNCLFGTSLLYFPFFREWVSSIFWKIFFSYSFLKIRFWAFLSENIILLDFFFIFFDSLPHLLYWHCILWFLLSQLLDDVFSFFTLWYNKNLLDIILSGKCSKHQKNWAEMRMDMMWVIKQILLFKGDLLLCNWY